MACGLRQTGFAGVADIWHPRPRARRIPKKKGTGHRDRSLNRLLSAFGNDRRRRGFALADVGLCRGRNAKEC